MFLSFRSPMRKPLQALFVVLVLMSTSVYSTNGQRKGHMNRFFKLCPLYCCIIICMKAIIIEKQFALRACVTVSFCLSVTTLATTYLVLN